MITTTELSHQLIEKIDIQNDLCIDMTVGRGLDTLYLSQRCKSVIGFDVQTEAIESTVALLKENHQTNVKLYRTSHVNVLEYVNEPVGLVIYNLGYLPHGNHLIKTESKSTLSSLERVLPLLRKDGKCIIVVYPKHPGNEAMTVNHFCSRLASQEYDVLKYSIMNKELAPYIIEIIKL